MRMKTKYSPTLTSYESMADALFVYDVEQDGWEHEHKGRDFNAGHVLKELNRAKRKSFVDPEVVQDKLVPDAVQYALRLSRWANFPTVFALPTVDLDKDIDAYCDMNDIQRKRLAGWAMAEISLGDYLHKLDHELEIDRALSDSQASLARTAKCLLYFAEVSADDFQFDIEQSFSNRLYSLRERFGMSHPGDD